MHTEIAMLSYDNSPALRRVIEMSLSGAVGRLQHRVARIAVKMSDVNGPRGGQDQRCGIEVTMRWGKVLRLHAIHEDAYAAVNLAFRKLKRALERMEDRRVRRRNRVGDQRRAEMKAKEAHLALDAQAVATPEDVSTVASSTLEHKILKAAG